MAKRNIGQWTAAMGARLRIAARDKLTQEEIVSGLGGRISKPTLQRIFAGKSDPGDLLPALAELIGVDEAFVLSGEEAHAGRVVEVPVTDIEVSAGPGRFAAEGDGENRWPFPADWVATHFGDHPRLVVVSVRGDSQEPDLRDGDRVVVNLNETGLAEGLHVVRLDDTLLLKRIQVEGARVRLKSRNAAYDDILVDLNSDQDRFAVVARAGWAFKRL